MFSLCGFLLLPAVKHMQGRLISDSTLSVSLNVCVCVWLLLTICQPSDEPKACARCSLPLTQCRAVIDEGMGSSWLFMVGGIVSTALLLPETTPLSQFVLYC